MEDQERMRSNGCDFLWKKSPKGGWSIYVRKSLEDERTLIGTTRSAKHAESFAHAWAFREAQLMKEGRPSQLVRPATKRVAILEEE